MKKLFGDFPYRKIYEPQFQRKGKKGASLSINSNKWVLWNRVSWILRVPMHCVELMCSVFEELEG